MQRQFDQLLAASVCRPAVCRMIRFVKRYWAIRSYVKRMSRDLVRRFGKKSFYSIDEVRQAVQRGKFSEGFIAYARAAFCSQEDFDAHYKPLGVRCTYDGLRRTIGRRYLQGQLVFDATTIINRFSCPGGTSGGFYESGIGEDYP